MGEHIRLESVWYNAPVVGKNGSSSIDPLTAIRIDEGGYATIYRVPIQPGLPVGGPAEPARPALPPTSGRRPCKCP